MKNHTVQKKSLLHDFQKKVSCSKNPFVFYRKSILFKQNYTVKRKLIMFEEKYIVKNTFSV